MAGRAALLALVAAGAGLAVPDHAVALDGLRIAPSRVDARVQRGDRLPAVRVSNDSPVAVTVTAEARRAGAALDGLPEIDDAPGARRRGRAFLTVSPERFTLRPGASRVVGARVVGGAVRGRGAYGVVLVSGRAAGAAERGDAQVAPVLRLAANVLLRFPGRAHPQIAARSLRVAGGPGRSLQFLARAANRGHIHGPTATRLVVRDARGRVRAREEVESAGAVLPYARRDLVTELRRVLPAGRYAATVEVRAAERVTRASTRFRLVGPNELPEADLRLAGLEPPAPDPGDGFSTEVTVRNGGTAAGRGTVEALLSTQRGREVARRSVRTAAVGAGASTTAELGWPGLPAGAYQLTVRLAGGGERTVVFETGTSPSMTARLLDWMAANLPLLIALLALAALVTGVAVVLHLRALRRRLREATAAR